VVGIMIVSREIKGRTPIELLIVCKGNYVKEIRGVEKK
jgi:hypothetical protein